MENNYLFKVKSKVTNIVYKVYKVKQKRNGTILYQIVNYKGTNELEWWYSDRFEKIGENELENWGSFDYVVSIGDVNQNDIPYYINTLFERQSKLIRNQKKIIERLENDKINKR